MSLYGVLGLVKWPHLNKLKKYMLLSVIGLKVMSQKKLHPRHSLSTEDEIAKTIQSEPSLSNTEVIDKCFGTQTHNNVFGYGGGMKRKHVIGSNSAREKELEKKVQEKDEENRNLKRRLDEIEDWKKKYNLTVSANAEWWCPTITGCIANQYLSYLT